MITFTKMPKYDAYKDSGVHWLGIVPASWELTRLGTRFIERRTKVSDIDYPALSVTKKGIMPQLDNAAKTKDGDNRKLVKKGDFVINSRSDRKGSSGISDKDGSVSLINIVLEPKGINPKFSGFLLKNYSFIEEYYRVGRGIVADLWTTRYDEMRTIIIAVPSEKEQTLIADFLDKKTAQIDEAIAIKEKQIELLKERKQIIIQNAVTKGLDPTVPMKNSGVDWIGMIPAHWEVKKLKFIASINSKSLDENTLPNKKIEYIDIGSVSFENGIEKTEIYLFKDSPSRARRLADEGDIAVSTVRTYLKAIIEIGYRHSTCVYSTGFAILKPLSMLESKFLSIFTKSDVFTTQVTLNSKGMSYPAINSTDLANLLVFIPSKKEQLKIISFIEKEMKLISQCIKLQNQQIEKLKEYKTTLINSAVTGKIKITPAMVKE